MEEKFRTRPAPTTRQFATALIVCAVLALIIGIAVSALHWPFAVGLLIGLVLLAGLIGWALWYYR